ncbi:c-type cytochrome [Salinicoccus sp. HZC-1]|uniref:c-type cytochrome n=1 Tax=Salinicoccus sp. HZC-1 TaxID=3385497 RepID=UPI00398B5DBD
MANDKDKHVSDKDRFMKGQKDEDKTYVDGQNREMIDHTENDKKNPLAWIIPIIIVLLLIPLVIHLVTGNGGVALTGGGEEEESAEESSGGGEEESSEESSEGGGEQASSGDFDAEGFARDNCASCHGQDFSGGMGPALAGTSLDEGEFTDVVRNGRGQMPSFSQDQIADEDLTALYEFMAGQ